MTNWAQGKYPDYDIPSETHYFKKLSLAISFHEIDREVIDRQDREWIEDLYAMLRAQAPPSSDIDASILLPEGVRLQPKG